MIDNENDNGKYIPNEEENSNENEVEIADENTKNEHDLNNIEKNDDNIEDEESELCDEDIALDNLLMAENIYKEFLADYLEDDLSKKDKEVSEDILKEIFGLAEVYLKMGDLETCKSDFPEAVEKYLKALKIRKQFDNKFSRCIAEIYFNLHKVYDFDTVKCFTCIVKARLIMEYHIKNKLSELGKNNLCEHIEINESLLDLEDMDYKTIKLKNKLYYENIEFSNESLPNNINDLVEIVKELDQKVNLKIINIFINILD